jgi:hypothetical protein
MRKSARDKRAKCSTSGLNFRSGGAARIQWLSGNRPRIQRLKKYSPQCIFLLHAKADTVFFKSELVNIRALPAMRFAQEDDGTN